jgi:hypothetical protein
MKEQAKDFGTNKQWKELGSDVSKLRGKIDNLDVAWARVDAKLNDLVSLAETARLLTYVGVIAVMTTLLLNQYFG